MTCVVNRPRTATILQGDAFNATASVTVYRGRAVVGRARVSVILPGPRQESSRHHERDLPICATASKRRLEEQESHLPFPFTLEAAFGQENQIVDSLPDWGDGPYLEDTWHGVTRSNSIQCVLRQC